MTEPSLPDIYPNDLGTEIYQGLQPLIDKYGDIDQHLWIYVHALAWMLKATDDISKDGPDDEPGWSQIFDLQRAKTEWLPWMGQIVGYQVPERKAGQSLAAYDAEQRERIVTRSAHRRGTVHQMVDIIKEHLAAPKDVIVQERYNGNPYQIKIWVYTAQIVTSSAAILRDINKQKVAGLVLELGLLENLPSYNHLRANSASYTIAKAKFSSYNEVRTNPAKP